MTEKRIHIIPNGGTGNRMFQHMLAQVIKHRVPAAEIVGSHLPEWGLASSQAPWPPGGKVYKINSHEIPLEWLIKRFGRDQFDTVLIRSPSTRLSYYEARHRLFRKTFRLQRVGGVDFARTLVMHVRLNKMSKYGRGGMQSVHRDYPVMPIAWYADLIDRSGGLEPLFVGEFGDDPVSAAMKARFPAARFIRNHDPMADFRMLYSAEHIAIGPSTFSWLAAWLSPYSSRIIVPMAGLLNPQQRPDIDLLPVRDPRCTFYDFPVELWVASPEQVDAVINGGEGFSAMAREAVITKYFQQQAS